MTEMQSAIGRIQLARLPQWLERRRANAASLIGRLRNVPGIRLPEVPEGIEHAFYKFNFLVAADRECPAPFHAAFLRDLIDSGVPASAGTCPNMSKEHAFAARGFSNPVELAGADFVGARNVTLPVDHTLVEADMIFMADAIRSSLPTRPRPVELIR
jgi:dTDP-4-amino-4,6-dideoxygalactose transaminase